MSKYIFQSNAPRYVRGIGRMLKPGEEITSKEEVAVIEQLPNNSLKKRFVKKSEPAPKKTESSSSKKKEE